MYSAAGAAANMHMSSSLPSRIIDILHQRESNAQCVEVSNLTRVPSISSPVVFDLELSDKDGSSVASSVCIARASNSSMDRSVSDLQLYRQQLKECAELAKSPMHRLLQLCFPASELEVTLANHLRCLRSGTGGRTPDVEELAAELLQAGYLVQIRDGSSGSQDGSTAKAASRNCLRNLRHSFLVCTGYHVGGEPVYLPEPIIVEPRFKEQFLIANPTNNYETLIQATPISFVGTMHRLESAVGILAEEVSVAFKQQKRALPPWRTKQAMLSKWVPAQIAELAKLLQRNAGVAAPVGSGIYRSAFATATAHAVEAADTFTVPPLHSAAMLQLPTPPKLIPTPKSLKLMSSGGFSVPEGNGLRQIQQMQQMQIQIHKVNYRQSSPQLGIPVTPHHGQYHRAPVRSSTGLTPGVGVQPLQQQRLAQVQPRTAAVKPAGGPAPFTSPFMMGPSQAALQQPSPRKKPEQQEEQQQHQQPARGELVAGHVAVQDSGADDMAAMPSLPRLVTRPAASPARSALPSTQQQQQQQLVQEMLVQQQQQQAQSQPDSPGNAGDSGNEASEEASVAATIAAAPAVSGQTSAAPSDVIPSPPFQFTSPDKLRSQSTTAVPTSCALQPAPFSPLVIVRQSSVDLQRQVKTEKKQKSALAAALRTSSQTAAGPAAAGGLRGSSPTITRHEEPWARITTIRWGAAAPAAAAPPAAAPAAAAGTGRVPAGQAN